MRSASSARGLVEVLRDESGLDLGGLVAECESAGTTLSEVLESADLLLPNAARQAYAEGARSLLSLGRGEALVLNYLRSAPLLASELGPAAVRELVRVTLAISPLTSVATLGLIVDTAPVAASCLCSEALFDRYLAILHHLASTAPRGLPAVLGNLEELLSKLSLSGFLRWIDFGTRSYRHEYDNLVAYFELELPESRAVLERERSGVLLTTVHRRLRSYLRALWGRDFRIQPYLDRQSGLAQQRPYLLDGVLHLPDGVQTLDEKTGIAHYQAMATHLASHLMYGSPQRTNDELDPARRYFIGVAEDAVVEHLATQRLPGLRSLWAAPGDDAPPGPLALHGGFGASAAYIREWNGRPGEDRPSADSVRAAGLQIYDVAVGRGPLPSIRTLHTELPRHRDDNRFLWSTTEFAPGVVVPAPRFNMTQVRRDVSPLMMAHTLDSELATDDADEIWTCTDLMRIYEDDLTSSAATFNDLIGSSGAGTPVTQREWDYQTQAYRPDWVTICERRAARTSPDACADVLVTHKGAVRAIEQIIDQLSPVGFQRIRGVEDGDELDLPFAVDAMVSMRSGRQPDPRIMSRNVIHHRDLAVVVLLDLSESTKDFVPGTSTTILSVVFDASVLLATAMEGIGDAFAIHGFASEGRHGVNYVRLKSFEDAFDNDTKGRLAGMTAGLSTRMGAGLRYAGQALSRRGEHRKLVLLVTDGEPADVDELDPEYLREDTRKAVLELQSIGVSTHCLTIDSQADTYVEDLFGAGRFTVLDRIDRLPAELPKLFAALTR